jgi:hypothetical protein
MKVFHKIATPSLYLEIGIARGATLSLAQKKTLCVGVDPKILITEQLIAPTKLFKMKSDRFFAVHGADCLGKNIDLAFIDGAHEYKQVLRDINNVLLHSHQHTLIIVHDVIPFDNASAAHVSTTGRTGYWGGDVYKALPFLLNNLPEVRYTLIHAYPTGLLAISALPPDISSKKIIDDEKQINLFQSISFDNFHEEWLPKFNAIHSPSDKEEKINSLIVS